MPPPTPTEGPSIPSLTGTNHLFRLPAELRLEIYSYTLLSHKITSAEKPHAPPLMLTSRLLRHEMLKPYSTHLITLLETHEHNWEQKKEDISAAHPQKNSRPGFHSMDAYSAQMQALMALYTEHRQIMEAIQREQREVAREIRQLGTE